MKRITAVLAIALCMLAVSACAEKAKNILEEDLDMKTVKTFMEYGQLFNMIYDDEGNLTHRMCGVLVDAEPDLVWEVINDFEKYPLFIKSMQPPKIREKDGNRTIVDFVLKIQIIAMIKSTQKYSTLYIAEKPRLYMGDPANEDAEMGFWEIRPTDNGTRTMLFYYDPVPDLMTMGKLVAGLVKSKPEFALALQVSPISILLNEAKAYTEKLAKKSKE